MENGKVAVVIPCYRVGRKLPGVVAAMPASVELIYCVDDCCPERSTESLEGLLARDPRIRILQRSENGGVGAAVMTGYRQAVADGAEIIVKLDGDGQMDPNLVPLFVQEIRLGRADYVKGNRFYFLDSARSMPLSRKIGNMGLSFMTKLSSGYWRLFDPTNGFTAIHASLIRSLDLDRIEPRYFFESDMLFHLRLLRARIVDVPMRAVYEDEASGLSNLGALFSFPLKHARNFLKRVLYDYFLRDFSIASVELLVGVAFLLFGAVFGIVQWVNTAQTGLPATAGTVMLASLPTIIGVQLILNFFAYDMAHEPDQPVHDRLASAQEALLVGRN